MPVDKRARASLDPCWIVPIYKATTGQDFLSLRAVQTNIAGYLLPGIITITPRARYYAFYSWLLVEYQQAHPEGMSLASFIKQREQIFVLANLAWEASVEGGAHEGGLIGSDKLGGHWEKHQASGRIPLKVTDYLAAKHGGYDQYAGVMRTLGIERWAGDVLEILPKGQRLARAFSEAIAGTEYYEDRKRYDIASHIQCDVLEEYGNRCHLSGLATSPDGIPSLEILFAFGIKNELPPPESDSTIGNMKGSLGLILDIIDQTAEPLTEYDFRQTVAHGMCKDHAYQPAMTLKPFLAHWQMFQLREYYTYAIYALWCYFLYWLRLEGPRTLSEFCIHLEETIDLTAPSSAVALAIPSRSASQWSLAEWFAILLNAAGIDDDDWGERCKAFAEKSEFSFNEDHLYQLLERTPLDDSATYVGTIWLMLSTLYLRLHGLRDSAKWNNWYWAEAGGVRRRSLAQFAQDLSSHVEAGNHISDAWRWLCRDYVIAQHITAALEKWRQRKANTFHFNYDQGVFEWVEDGFTGFSGSRFRQAYDMLADLGLYEIDVQGRSSLTQLGRQTLQRVLENLQ
jgi:hypothetical protein